MSRHPAPASPRRGWRPNIPERYLRVLALLAVAAVAVLAFALRDVIGRSATEAVGYPAVFLVSLLGNATVLFPVPAIVAVCWGGIVLMPLLVGLLAGVAMALGEMTGYLAGFSGSSFARNNRLYRRIQPWMQRRGWLVVLTFAMVPNPFFDIIGVAAGATRIPVWQFLAAAWVGKTSMGIMTAYGCALGSDLFRQLAQVGG